MSVEGYERLRVRAALAVGGRRAGSLWLVVAVVAALVVVGVAMLCLSLSPARAATVAPAQHEGLRSVHQKWNTF